MIRFGPRQEDQTSTSRSRQRWSRLVPMLALVGVVVLLSGCGSEVVQPYSIYASDRKSQRYPDPLQDHLLGGADRLHRGAGGHPLHRAAIPPAQRGPSRAGTRLAQAGDRLDGDPGSDPARALHPQRASDLQARCRRAGAGQVRCRRHRQAVVVGVPVPRYPRGSEQSRRRPPGNGQRSAAPRRCQRRVPCHQQQRHPLLLGAAAQRQGRCHSGHDNPLQFVASTPGDYFGECAEFCGSAHAWMRFKVKVVPEENFDAWVAAWRTPPAFDANARRPPMSWRLLPPSAPASPATTSPAPMRASPNKGWG